MRKTKLFAAGLFVGFAVHFALAQNAGNGVVMMNHVCINLPNIEEAVLSRQRRQRIIGKSMQVSRSALYDRFRSDGALSLSGLIRRFRRWPPLRHSFSDSG